MTLVFDIDGCLANFESAWNPLLTKLNGGVDNLPKGWQDDPGFPNIWDWDVRAYGPEIVKQGWNEVRKSTDFWSTLKPMRGVDGQLGRQIDRIQKSHDVFYLTSRPGLAVQRQTAKWLYDHLLISYPSVIVVNHFDEKWPILESLQARFFVDDKLETVEGWYTHCYKQGIKVTEPNYYALIDAPYNADNRTIKGMRVANSVEAAIKEAGLWL